MKTTKIDRNGNPLLIGAQNRLTNECPHSIQSVPYNPLARGGLTKNGL